MLGYGSYESDGHGFRGSSGDDTFGIEIGSGSTSENFNDYALATKITNGSSAGQLAFATSNVPVIAYVAGTKTFTVAHVRYFNNNSGGDVTVNETGLVSSPYQTDISNIGATMWSRDVLGAPVVVPTTGQLKVTYTLSLAYPA
jgi:hypothetical protein